MKKIGVLTFIILTFFTNASLVQAACETAETNKLNNLAVKVKASYEEDEIEADPDSYTPPEGLDPDEVDGYVEKEYVFNIYITNITEELYVKVTNSFNNEEKVFYYSDTDNGTVSFMWDNLLSITEFKIEIYSSDKTNCPNTKLHTTRVTTPMYNDYSTYTACEGNEDFYLCRKYLSVSTVGYEKFVSLLTNYKEGKIDTNGEEIKEEEKKGFIEFIKEHKAAVALTSVAIIAVGGLVTVIIVKKQRSRIV